MDTIPTEDGGATAAVSAGPADVATMVRVTAEGISVALGDYEVTATKDDVVELPAEAALALRNEGSVEAV